MAHYTDRFVNMYYESVKEDAKNNNIPFTLTLSEWYTVWFLKIPLDMRDFTHNEIKLTDPTLGYDLDNIEIIPRKPPKNHTRVNK